MAVPWAGFIDVQAMGILIKLGLFLTSCSLTVTEKIESPVDSESDE